jgi:uncharacterized protein (TIGR01777 family)
MPAAPGATARVEHWDGATLSGWERWVNGAGAVVNLAGESIGGNGLAGIFLGPWTRARKQGILESRLNAGRALTEAVRYASRKPQVLIQSCAVGYYGPREEEGLREETPAGKDFLAGVCAAWESSTSEVGKMGVRRAIIRSGLALSLSGGIFPVMTLPFSLFVGGRLGSGRQWAPWIHLTDLVRAIVFLIGNGDASGPYNLVAPQFLRNADFERILGRVMRRPYWLPVPAFALRLILGEKATLVLDGQQPSPRRLTEVGFTFRYPELEGALRDILR